MRYKTIDPALFINNRRRLVKGLKPGSVAVFNSNDTLPTNADGTMSFRQNNDLFYLSGIDQEESMLVLCPDFPDKQYSEVLFLKEPNELMEKWEGHKLTRQEGKTISGIETVVWLPDFNKLFHNMMTMGGAEHVYLNTNEHYRADVLIKTRDARFIEWCKSAYPLHKYNRVAPLLSDLRRVKHKQEIELLQKACDITESGFRRALKFAKPGVLENEIEAEYIHEFIRLGSMGFAYSPIIASGANAVILHYIEYAHYNADLTRTIPVSGRFSKRQKEVYNAVLRVQREGIEMLRPSVVYFDFQKEIEKLMEGEMIKLKLIDKTDIKNQKPESTAFRKYFYHGTSHMLGLDVHDVGNIYDKVQIGSVWTVEPGIYIKEEGLGIRLENNVVIQKDKNIDLMRTIPIEAEEIEEIMNA